MTLYTTKARMQSSEEIQNSNELEARALEECNRERIEIPGRIQGHGALIAFDFRGLNITFASDNIDEFLEFEGEVFDRTLLDVFSRDDVHSISNVASHESAKRQREHVKVIKSRGKDVEISLFRVDSNVVLELVPIVVNFHTHNVSANVKRVLSQAHAFQEINDILNKTVDALREITGFRRVMAYTFLPDHSGEVVAEAMADELDHSYMGLRFPASDIPQRARDLFLKNSIRIIIDTTDEGIPIRAADPALKDLDLTYGILRAVSPIHNQYLRNMGVATSLTLPIIVEGRLWGLLAHHHTRHIQLTPEIIYSAEIIGQAVSMAIEHNIRRKVEEKAKRIEIDGRDWLHKDTNPLYLEDFWAEKAHLLQSLIASDGIAYRVEDTVLTHGYTPAEQTVTDIDDHFHAASTENVQFTTDLASLGFEGLSKTRGVLRMGVSESGPRFSILFFRNEVDTQIHWAGNPKKDLEFVENKVRLHPRSSFEHYQQLHSGMSDEWGSDEISTSEIACSSFRKILENKEDREKREEQETQRLNLVVRELNHRVRNILNLVRSISRQTANEEHSIASYIEALGKRINALAEANEQLTGTEDGAISLKDIIEKELLPYQNAFNPISIYGPTVYLPADVLPVVVLVVHELATNAVKYGSLSCKGGTLETGWYRNSEGLRISWQESGGPEVIAPDRSGFGRTVIENALQYEFGGSSKVEFLREGLRAEFFIPSEALVEARVSTVLEPSEPPKPGTEYAEETQQWHILVVEDDFVSARETSETLKGLGLASVHCYPDAESALRSMKLRDYRMALLDIHLKEETSESIAWECRKRNIDLRYLTGNHDLRDIDGRFPEAPVIQKPIDPAKLQEAISSLFL